MLMCCVLHWPKLHSFVQHARFNFSQYDTVRFALVEHHVQQESTLTCVAVMAVGAPCTFIISSQHQQLTFWDANGTSTA